MFDLLNPAPKERYSKTIESGTWQTNKNFSEKDALSDIESFVTKWELDEQWLFCIDHIGTEETEFAKNYKYNVRFSIPTRKKPIPTATASVFFTLSQSTVPGKENDQISVTYQVEGFRLTQSPGAFAFQQQWLYETLESKAKFIKLVDF